MSPRLSKSLVPSAEKALLAWGVLAALVAFGASACTPNSSGGGVNQDTLGKGQGGADLCATPNTGCACTNEGQLAPCGEVSGTTPDGRVTCAMGYRRCESGHYTKCDALQNLTPKSLQEPGAVKSMSGPNLPNGKCATACDPYCQQSAEAPDGGWQDDGGATGSAWDASPDAPPPQVVAIMADAGIAMDGGRVYHQLAPGQTAVDPINVTTTVNSVDVYFLLNSTSSMQSSIDQLATQIPTVVSSIQQNIPNVAIGEGRFTNYQAWPYGSQQQGNVVFENRVSITTNGNATVNDFTWMKNNPSSVFVNTPYIIAQSSAPGLYAMASNETLQGWVNFSFPGSLQSDWWWNVNQYYGDSSGASLLSPFYSAGAACTNGGAGAPCFRPNSYHIVMLLQDAPMANGPAGSFPYYQFKPQYFPWNAQADYTTDNSWYWYQSTSLGTVPTLPTNSGATGVIAIPSAKVGQPQVFTGNVMGGASQSQVTLLSLYDPSAKQKCTLNGGSPIGTGPDAAYDFVVPAGGTNYWFDTVGSSYDTVLYLVDKSSGLLMGCMDDSFSWLSAVSITGSGVPDSDRNIGQYNSALLGFLPQGSYRLVVDKHDATAYPSTSSNKGIYQLNLWPNIDDPRLGGNPHGTHPTTPSYRQMLSALKGSGVGAYVASIEMSGATCGQQVTSWEKSWTRWSLEQLATDTGAVVGGTPVVYSVQQNGTPGPVSGNDPRCPSGTNLGTVVSNAIANLSGNLAQSVTATAVDFDDLTDFDGVKGTTAGNTVLTPTNIDDATFVTSIVANPVTGCTGPAANTYASCGPGAQPKFTVNFAVPSNVQQSGNVQIFYFRIELRGQGNVLLGTTPVTIVVPPMTIQYTPTDFVRDYDGTDACPTGSQVVWGVYNWTTTTPGDSHIEFYGRAAKTLSGLDTATEFPYFGVAHASPNTQIGAADVGAYFTANKVKANTGFARIRAHLSPTSDATQTPVLTSWSFGVECLPAQ